MTQLRHPHNEETATLLGYPSAAALRSARRNGRLPAGTYFREGRRWYYLIDLIRKDWERRAYEQATTERTLDGEGAVSNLIHLSTHPTREAVPGETASRNNAAEGRNIPVKAKRRRSSRRPSVAERKAREGSARAQLRGILGT